ncbi:MAG TPA: 2-amino-4-hydroxy-6-hydroxymethyldihydropteridine diphosphokinase [Dongiaceae bacterium]|nr:2-amino-4-hydroxy-6-hydroxymethyldihydropteridine diphosphokinase [Dongiaceae bacterium]
MSERVFLGLGSNCNREQNLLAALRMLREAFGVLRVSPVYSSEPHPALSLPTLEPERQHYFNLVVEIRTDLPVVTLKKRLLEIERACGRVRGTRMLACPQDIDILLYGDVVGEVDGMAFPHPDIDRCAFVLLPLSQLAPTALHPRLRQSFAELWRAFDATAQPLTEVSLERSDAAMSG